MPTDTAAQVETVHVDKLTVRPELLQMREAFREDVAEDYAENLSDLPEDNIKARRDPDGVLWVWDGFHTLEAYKSKGRVNVPVSVSEGTFDDALLSAAAANRSHGLQRTVEDKGRAVRAVVSHPTFRQWTDRRIAAHVGVTDHFVAGVRATVEAEEQARAREAEAPGGNGRPKKKPAQKPQKRVGKDGRTYPARKPRRKKPGAVVFDLMKRFEAPFGAVVRSLDQMYRAYGKVKPDGVAIARDDEYRAMNDALGEFRKLFLARVKQLSKETPPESD